MCGIAGKLNFSSDEFVDRRTLYEMGVLLKHRGPGRGRYLGRSERLVLRMVPPFDYRSQFCGKSTNV